MSWSVNNGTPVLFSEGLKEGQPGWRDIVQDCTFGGQEVLKGEQLKIAIRVMEISAYPVGLCPLRGLMAGLHELINSDQGHAKSVVDSMTSAHLAALWLEVPRICAHFARALSLSVALSTPHYAQEGEHRRLRAVPAVMLGSWGADWAILRATASRLPIRQ